MASTTSKGRPLRADAQRNWDRIVAVSEQHFVDRGVSASLEDIARDAGVGVGTLYRHFPSREALIAEILAGRQEQLNRRLAEIQAGSSDAATALRLWLSALTEWASAFDGLPAPLRDAISVKSSPLSLTCEGYITATDELLAAAQQEGSARTDARGRDLFLMTLAASWARAAALADPASASATVDLIRTGWATAG